MGGSSSTEAWKGYEHMLLTDTKMRSVALPDSAEEGASAILRHPRAVDGYAGFLKSEDGTQEYDTAQKLYRMTIEKNGDKEFVGFRPFMNSPEDIKKRGAYKYISFNEFDVFASAYGKGFRSLGLSDLSNVGIFSMNRPEWYMVHCANLSQGFRTVALYDTLGPDAVAYIIRHAEVPMIVCEKNKLPALFEAVRGCRLKEAKAKAAEDGSAAADDDEVTDEKKTDSDDDSEESALPLTPLKLKIVIQMDFNALYGNSHEAVSDLDVATAKELGLSLRGLSSVFSLGESAEECKSSDVSPEDVAYIMYTSGTTGNPKGVLLPHRSFAAMVGTCYRVLQPIEADRHMSYLPLAHIFEAMVCQCLASAGCRLAFYQGDVRKLLEDWKAVRPTVLVGVPRVFNKTYDKFQMKVKGFGTVKKWLVESAQVSSTKYIRKGKRSKFYDQMVWGSVSTELGFDRVRLVVSGAAPLPPHIAEFLRILLPTADIIQGYGMTENTAGCTLTDLDDLNLGHVGVPVDNNELRLVDAPECGYLVTDSPHPRGEIVMRGLTTMVGYYKDAEKTSSTVDSDGWLHTGDIGRINPNGTVSIIDRRKNMFKTAMGEYIASERVEQVYARASSVAQIFVYGNSYKSFVVAIVVADASVMEVVWKAKGLWTEEHSPATQAYADYFGQLAEANMADLKRFVVTEMRAEDGILKGFEKVKDVFIEYKVDSLMQGFTVENGCLTPTFKLKRPQLLRKYMDDIKKLYTDNGEAPMEAEHW